MSSSSFATALRGLCLVLIVAFVLAAFVPAVQAEALSPSRAAAPTLVAGITDYFIGNRSRMVQTTFIAFGLGILILVTATRKH